MDKNRSSNSVITKIVVLIMALFVLLGGITEDTVYAMKGVEEDKPKLEKAVEGKTEDEIKKMCKNGGVQTAYGTSRGKEPYSIDTNKKVADKVWKKLKEFGYTDYGASGVMGNLLYESMMNPGTEEQGVEVQGFGLVQWTGGRRTNLENFAKEKGKKVSDVDLQMDFFKDEMEKKYGGVHKKLKSVKNVADAEYIFLSEFEIPAPNTAHDVCRILGAYQYYNKYKGTGGGSKDEKASESSEPDESGKFDKTRGEYTGNLEFDPFIKQKPVNKSTGVVDGNEATLQAQDTYPVSQFIEFIGGLILILICVVMALYFVFTAVCVLVMASLGMSARIGENRIVRALLGAKFVDKLLSNGLSSVIGKFLLRMFISALLFLLAITGYMNGIQSIVLELVSNLLSYFSRLTGK